MDWKGRADSMVTTFTRHHSPGLLSLGLQNIVYRTKVGHMTDEKQRISNVIATIDETMLQRTWQKIEYRLDVLRATKGFHVEVY